MKRMNGKLKVAIIAAAAVMLLFVIFSILNRGDSSHYSMNDEDTVTSSIDYSDGHITTAVQQIMIGSRCSCEKQARETLKAIKDSGYEAIELNDFMIHRTGLTVKLLTKAAGMPVGNGGRLNWPKLIEESGLKVVSLHTYLTSIEENPRQVAEEARCFGTDKVVITAMYRFDYSDKDQVLLLADRLNEAGRALSGYGIELLYHNHNVELQKVDGQKTAYDLLIENTDGRYVNFEFDSYWMQDGGADVASMMTRLGSRLKLWHINDRGNTEKGPYMTPILKQKATELGYGNMNLEYYAEIAKANGLEGVIVETHNNWINDDPVQSLEVSSDFIKRVFE